VERDIVDLLREDHTRMDGLLTELDRVGSPHRREQAVSELVAALGRHLDAEEALLEPVVRKLLPSLMAELLREHADLKHLLTRLDYLDYMARFFGSFELTLGLLEEMVRNHIEEAEETIFPRVLRDVPATRRYQLGAQFVRFSATTLMSA